VRVTTVFKRLLRLDGVNVCDVEFLTNLIVVSVVLRRSRLICPYCGYKTSARYDTRCYGHDLVGSPEDSGQRIPIGFVERNRRKWERNASDSVRSSRVRP